MFVLNKIQTLAAPLDSKAYTYFRLTSKSITINRRGKPYVFKRGDPLGWRLSHSGKFVRIISPLYGANIVFSLELNDVTLKWLSRQDPKAVKKRSLAPEHVNDKLEGYAVKKGKTFYRLNPKPIFSETLEPVYVFKNQNEAKKEFGRFILEKKLKVVPIYTTDLEG